ncbi:MAG: DNA methyltransferase [Desulfococcaceae bacterium]
MSNLKKTLSSGIEKNILTQFYADYRHSLSSLFNCIREQNPDIAETVLLNKSRKLLDRILVICFCEDFGILPYFTFRGLLKSVKEDKFSRSDSKIYQRAKALFDAINRGYPEENINKFNGGLFADDEILDNLIIKDVILEDVIALERYDFASDLNVNILGHIFEQSVTDMEELKAEIAGQDFDRKKGKRKKEGIFYTPEYITRYIVEEAVGGWLADRKTEIGFDSLPELTQADYDCVKKTSKKRKMNKNIDLHIQALETYREKLKNIRVLDPACGSGAFLNQVFDFLYKEGQKVNSEIAMLKGGQREVFDLDKDILTNNIFGVDLNDESAEITKLSLWLKTANKNKELTTLDANIKCGNSLIDDPAVAGDKAFDWNKEFPEIMKNGGFDVVVGNPPYVRQELLGDTAKYFYSEKYPEVYNSTADLYVYFYALSVNLLKNDGLLGFITSNKWMERKYGFALRQFLKPYEIIQIINFGELKIFEDASTEPAIVILKKKKTDQRIKYASIKSMEESHHIPYKTQNFEKEMLNNDIWRFTDPFISSILNKFSKGDTTLDEYTDGGIYYGIKTGLNKVFIIDSETGNEIIKKDPNSAEIIKKMVEGNDFGKWHLLHSGRYMLATQYDLDVPNKYPAVYEYLKKYEKELIKRQDKGCSYWNLRACDYYDKLDKPKIIYYHTAVNHAFYLDNEGYYISANCYFISNADTYLQCILNSKLFHFAKKYLFPAFGDAENRGRVRLDANKMVKLPVKIISPEKKKSFADKADIMLAQNKVLQHLKQDFLTFLKNELKPVKITNKMENWPDLDWEHFKIEMKKAKVKFDDLNLKDRKQWQDYFLEQQEKSLEIKSIIDKTDKEIDKTVYDLYGLTEEEIRIVEGTDSKIC